MEKRVYVQEQQPATGITGFDDAGGKQKRGLGIRAKRRGTCSACGTAYTRNQFIVALDGRSTAHEECMGGPVTITRI